MLIFGFGSLINSGSLKATTPGAHNLKPAYLRGYKRHFSVPARSGSTDADLAESGRPFCALNISQTGNLRDLVNGIAFNLDDFELEKLLLREQEYSLFTITAYDFDDLGKCLGKAYAFISKGQNGTFDFDSKVQRRYTDICLQGSKEFGQKFYDTFINTTYLNNQKLADFTDLITI